VSEIHTDAGTRKVGIEPKSVLTNIDQVALPFNQERERERERERVREEINLAKVRGKMKTTAGGLQKV